MKNPSSSRGQHHKMDAGEQDSQGSTGKEVKGEQTVKAMDDDDDEEYNDEGKAQKGGGYCKKGGKMYKMAKSDELSADDLQKSLDKLSDFAADDPPNRKEQLLQKALIDELGTEENLELIQLMGGAETVQKSEPTVGDNISKSFTENEPLAKAVDVSEYLSEQHEAMTKSLYAIGDEIQKSDNRRHEFAMLQARALVDMGNLVKSLTETVESIAQQPVRQPKSRGVQSNTRSLNKSFGGAPPAEENISKSEVLDTLDEMFKKSVDEGNEGRLSTGEDLGVATTKFENTAMLSPTVLNALNAYRSQKTKVSH